MLGPYVDKALSRSATDANVVEDIKASTAGSSPTTEVNNAAKKEETHRSTTVEGVDKQSNRRHTDVGRPSKRGSITSQPSSYLRRTSAAAAADNKNRMTSPPIIIDKGRRGTK